MTENMAVEREFASADYALCTRYTNLKKVGLYERKHWKFASTGLVSED